MGVVGGGQKEAAHLKAQSIWLSVCQAVRQRGTCAQSARRPRQNVVANKEQSRRAGGRCCPVPHSCGRVAYHKTQIDNATAAKAAAAAAAARNLMKCLKVAVNMYSERQIERGMERELKKGQLMFFCFMAQH